MFIFPLGLAAAVLAVAWLFHKRRPGMTGWLIVLALGVLWLAGNRWVSYALVRSLEGQYPAPAEIPRTAALVVLGGGTRAADPPRPIVEVNEAGDRLLYAAHLYRSGKAERVLVTGGSIEWLSPEGQGPEAGDMSSLLDFLGVPSEALWVEGRSRNTYENALYSREILEEAGIDEILLVTSAMHMPRSVRLFENQGLTVIPAPTDYLVSDGEWRQLIGGEPESQLISLLPNAEYLTYTTRALKEYIGIVIYALRGWL